ncbi:unnamed protein product [Lymnaea stagnalis]|uniref:Uncharacterized protein n=1 Tax=Lymnaea stagnalis TaxID=6523 RepID=A0AAV2ICT9_LYMST
MLPNAVVFYGLMALLCIVGVNTDTEGPKIVENCQERTGACRKIATKDDEIVEKEKEIVSCFMAYVCKGEEDEHRVKALMEYGGKVADSKLGPFIPETGNMGEFGPHPGVTDKPTNMAVIISVSYKTLVASAVTMFLLA